MMRTTVLALLLTTAFVLGMVFAPMPHAQQLPPLAVTPASAVNGGGAVIQPLLFQNAGSVLFAALGALTNGTLVFCSDCTIANPCASGGTGGFAKRLNGVWVCN